MKLIIGIVLVIGCMISGFLLHHGKLILLYVPSEYLIIGGMSIGTLIIAIVVAFPQGIAGFARARVGSWFGIRETEA